MDKDSTERSAEAALFAGEAWFDPIETGLRERIRGFIEELLEQELPEVSGDMPNPAGDDARNPAAPA